MKSIFDEMLRETELESIEKSRRELAKISLQTMSLGLLAEESLPIEENLRSSIKSIVDGLGKRKTDLMCLLAKAHKYRLLSLEPLKWMTDDGLPRLVVFNIKSPSFTITYYSDAHKDRRWSSEKEEIIPRTIQSCYAGTGKAFHQMIENNLDKYRNGLNFTVRFNAAIPSHIRQEISVAQTVFQQIFIICELGKFEISAAPKPRIETDPIVAGWDGKNLWLIAKFDTTPVEEAIANWPTFD